MSHHIYRSEFPNRIMSITRKYHDKKILIGNVNTNVYYKITNLAVPHSKKIIQLSIIKAGN